ncbi:MAG: hypothetical protein QHJ82_14770 [Verrucomicrobiota bacterium]|nr:hypothetical protein [Verrucomicrobiota bacterium]
MNSTSAVLIRWRPAPCLAALLFCGAIAQPQTILDLDKNPQFDLAANPESNPTFAPETIGLTAGTLGFDRAASFCSFAAAATANFPPAREVFIALWAEPRYALLPISSSATAALGVTGPFSLASAFSGAIPAANIVPGRTAAWAGEPINVMVGGVQFELPGASAYVSPLVLDMDGDGVLGASRGLWNPHPARLTGPYAAFDIGGDGFIDVTEWLAPGDALLTTNPKPTNGKNLVGTAGGWPDGFADLRAVFDLNHDGKIEGEELDSLYLWRDANGNAIAEADEVMPVKAAGISSINAAPASDLISDFGRSDGSHGLVWDWWPNYALAIRRAAQPPNPGHFFHGQSVMADLNAIGLPLEIPATDAVSITERLHVSTDQLRAAGLDLATFQLALLADGGRTLIGHDLIAVQGGQKRPRLASIRSRSGHMITFEVNTIPLPMEEVYQMACDPSGRTVLVLGDHGSVLAIADFESGTVQPPGGLNLRSIGIRASGVAGDPMVRYSGTGNFWFTGWQLNEEGEVVDERVWAITPWGFWAGLSMDKLRNELGLIRSHFITGPMSGFFVVPDHTGTKQELWSVAGDDKVLVDTAGSFGGMHAIGAVSNTGQASATPKWAHGTVAYTKRDADKYSLVFWQPDSGQTVIETTDKPLFYPVLSDGSGTVAAAKIGIMEQQMDLEMWIVQNRRAFDHIGNFCGQGKASRGAFAVYDAGGIDILPVPDQTATAPQLPAWNYTLLTSSRLVDDCPICDRMPIVAPLQGKFALRLVSQDPLVSTYAVEDIEFFANSPQGQVYKVRGRGVYKVGGELPLLQDMTMEVWIDSGSSSTLCIFTNATPDVKRGWPIIHVTLDQADGTLTQQYQIELVAAPMREVFFSTTHGFTPGINPPPAKHVTGGDLVSDVGRVVALNRELTAKLGMMPSPEPVDLGLDAVDILPGSEIAFSIETDAFSETLGSLHHGDLLSNRGRVLAAYADLIGPFAPMPPLPDVGLDAVQVLGSGEVYFSIETDFFSQRLGVLVRRGDLLSSKGLVVKTQEQLLSQFHPPAGKDFGLDAIYVWPSGEVWFSVEESFEDRVLGWINHGDLLSDRGEVLYQNRDLLRNFQPLEDLADFGLDGIYIVSDAVVPPTTTARCIQIRPNNETGGFILRWETNGRVRQLEKAPSVLGPWTSVGPLTTDVVFIDADASGGAPQAFYRLREW